MTETMNIDRFLETLSSKAPVPGGGGASAVGGAIGNALGQMVANLTIGKKKYAENEEEIRELLARMQELQKEFINLADRDAQAFTPLAAAYSLPATNEVEKTYKEQVMEMNLLGASLVPVSLMERCMAVSYTHLDVYKRQLLPGSPQYLQYQCRVCRLIHLTCG